MKQNQSNLFITFAIGINSSRDYSAHFSDDINNFHPIILQFFMKSAKNILRILYLIYSTVVIVRPRFFETFPYLIETGSFSYVLTDPLSGVTINFKTAKNTTNYGQVLSFQKLSMPMDSNYCYSIYLQTANKYVYGLTFNIRMYSCSNSLQELSVRYLIIAPELSNDISLVEAQFSDFNNPLTMSQYSERTIYNGNKDSSQTHGVLILQGFATQGDTNHLRFDLNIDLYSTSFAVKVRRQSSYFQISFICVTAILMNNQISLRNTTGTLYRLSKEQQYGNSRSFSYGNSSGQFKDDSLFYGLESFVSANSNQLNFQFQQASTSELKLHAYDNPPSNSQSHLMIEVINFVFLICGSSTYQYFFPLDFTCLSACPDSYFCNGSEPLYCETCLSSCLTCQTSSSNCNSCANTSYLASNTCTPCVSVCITCTTQASCTSCIALYKLDGNNACVPNCSLISQCTQCNFVTPNVNCTHCNQGYGAVGGVCVSVCGDGYMNGAEACDDSNTADGDGCSSACLVEQSWACQPSGTGTSCSLIDVQIMPAYTVKSAKDNAFTSIYTIQPNLPFMNQIDWTQGISFISGSITIVSVIFDQTKGTLTMECTYAADLSEVTMEVDYSSLGTQFSTIATKQLPQDIATQNNLSLNFYSPTIYTLSAIMEYVCLGLSAVTLLLFLLGFLGGKLIALEHVAVFQLTYLCTVAVQNASPTSAALRKLQLSTGNIQLSDYDYSSNIDRQFKGINMGGGLFSSCNTGYTIVILPAIVAILLKLLSAACCKKSDKIKAIWPNILGELTFYGIMFSAYATFSKLFFGLLMLVNGNTQVVTSLGVTCVLGLITILYAYFLNKHPEYFGVFKKRFQRYNVSQYFYTFMVLERVLSPLVIIALRKLPMGLVAELLIVGAIIAFVALRSPYIEGDSRRALINLSIAAANILLLLVDNFLGKSPSVIIPIMVTFLLTASVGISTFFLIKQFKQIYQLKAESKQSSAFGVLFSNIFKYDKPENVQEKNEFQLQYFKNRIIDNSPSLNPILTSAKQEVDIRQKVTNEQWEFYATLSKGKFLNRLQSQKLEKQADGAELKSLTLQTIIE